MTQFKVTLNSNTIEDIIEIDERTFNHLSEDQLEAFLNSEWTQWAYRMLGNNGIKGDITPIDTAKSLKYYLNNNLKLVKQGQDLLYDSGYIEPNIYNQMQTGWKLTQKGIDIKIGVHVNSDRAKSQRIKYFPTVINIFKQLI